MAQARRPSLQQTKTYVKMSGYHWLYDADTPAQGKPNRWADDDEEDFDPAQDEEGYFRKVVKRKEIDMVASTESSLRLIGESEEIGEELIRQGEVLKRTVNRVGQMENYLKESDQHIQSIKSLSDDFMNKFKKEPAHLGPVTTYENAQPSSNTWNSGIVKATQYGILPRCKEFVLHWAAINNELDIARYCILVGAAVDVLGGNLMATPMHWAIREGHLPMVVLLMQYGADPYVRDAEGCASIHVAVQCSHTNIVAYLIAQGVDPDLCDSNGRTPLMWAAWRTFGIDPTRTLLSMLCNVNFQDRAQHSTALHYACMSQNTNVLETLVNAGADIEAKNDRGETPLDIATMKKNVWMMSRLTAYRRDKGLDSKSPSFLKAFKTPQTSHPSSRTKRSERITVAAEEFKKVFFKTTGTALNTIRRLTSRLVEEKPGHQHDWGKNVYWDDSKLDSKEAEEVIVVDEDVAPSAVIGRPRASLGDDPSSKRKKTILNEQVHAIEEFAVDQGISREDALQMIIARCNEVWGLQQKTAVHLHGCGKI